ncbi:MAG TPA: hypothetical protein VN108_00040 [Marmoricola sp.]|nr:hypothetical protein [Marmoricola sp.]
MSKGSARPRSVSKLSRYLYGIIEGFAALGFVIVGLLMLARGGLAGLVVIVIGVTLAIAALVNFRLAERAGRSGATTGSVERP